MKLKARNYLWINAVLLLMIPIIKKNVLQAQSKITNNVAVDSQALSNNVNGVYSFVEQMPEFPDGQDAMYKFITDNLQYPKTAREMKVQGTVVIQFVITKEGKVKKLVLPEGLVLVVMKKRFEWYNLCPIGNQESSIIKQCL